MKQTQFLEVLDRDDAEQRWRATIDAVPAGAEVVALEQLLGRVLAEDIRSEVDVPGFDRSNMDGFAVHAADTYGASEAGPMRLRLNAETIATGVEPHLEVLEGTATQIATGGMLPRGADAVVPVEHTDIEDEGATLIVRQPRVPGAALSFAGYRHGTRRDGAVFRHASVFARDGRARRHRLPRGGGLPPAAGGHPLHRR